MIEREEAVVHKGPRMNNLEGYKASIAKLADSCSELHKSGPSNSTGFANAQPKTKKDQDETLRRVQSAVDSGQKQLGQIALNTLRDNNFPASSSLLVPSIPTD